MIKKLHNGTLKTVTNIRVPKKWKRFEYLESTGTLYIDTGFYPNSDTRVLTELSLSNKNQTAILGGRTAYSSNCLAFVVWNGENNRFAFQYGPNAWNYRRFSSVPAANTKFVLDLNRNVGTIVNYSSVTHPYASFTSTGTLLIYSMSDAGVVDSRCTTMKCYSFKLYDSDTLIRDFVPCEYNGQYGMWDLVENKFYGNKGTGTFKVGHEIPNYDEVEYIKRPNHLLPNGVELYDCLECDGIGTYIDTEFKPDINSGFEIKCMYTEKCNADLFGAGGTYNTGFGLHTHGGTLAGFTNGVDLVDLSSNTLYSYNTYKYFNKIAYLNGIALTLKANATTPTISENICIGKAYRTKYQPIAVQFLKLYQETTLVRNFLPCTYFGEPGMWDTVTNKFYGNSGTGLFKLGNKIELKEYEWLENSINSYINTDFIPNSDSRAVLKITNTLYNSTRAAFAFGSRIDIPSQAFYTYMYKSDLKWCGNWDSNSTNVTTSESGPDGIIDFNKNILSINNKIVKEFNNVTWQGTKPVFIFGLNHNGSLDNQQGTYKLFYCKLYDNNTLVRDYYPCSYNGEYGLWDRVELKFYPNAGTGSFTVGPRVDGNVNIYEKKNALVRTSTAYINTGVVANNNTKLVAEIQYTTLANNGRFGSYGSDGRFYFGTMSNQWVAAYGTESSYNHSLGAADTNKHLFELNAEGFFIDGIKKYTSSPKNFTSKIELNCQVLQNGTGSYKIYWFKIYKDNTLVRDFIPATLGGKPGLYDKVEHKMYYNANSTGQFTVE